MGLANDLIRMRSPSSNAIKKIEYSSKDVSKNSWNTPAKQIKLFFFGMGGSRVVLKVNTLCNYPI